MVANVELVRRKLDELETFVAELESLQSYTLEDLFRLSHLWSVAHGLQLSIQIVLDIGNHLLADQNIKAIDYTEVIDKLGENGVLPIKFAKKIRGIAGFRNLLVHAYSNLEVERLYEILQNNLDDFTTFAHHVNLYIEKD